MKKELNKIPFWKWYMAKVSMWSTGPAASTMRQMVMTASTSWQRGVPSLFFLEGTRSEPGNQQISPGHSRPYRRIGATVIPVALNTGLFWGKAIFKTTWENDYPVPSRHANRLKQETIYTTESAIEDTTRDLEQEALRGHPHLYLNPVEKQIYRFFQWIKFNQMWTKRGSSCGNKS